MRFDNQLRHATRIIETYRGEIPLAVWLRDFFRANRQMGSRDRKELSALGYGFYRLGHSLRGVPVHERLLAGLFLCETEPSPLLQHYYPDWNAQISLPIKEKVAFFQTQPSGMNFQPGDIFPWRSELSPDIDFEAFCLSFLRQPDLFLRIRPGYKDSVLRKLAALPHEFIAPSTVRLPNGWNVEKYFTPDREVVVQDYSSQQIGTYLRVSKEPRSFWDTCAASGGKSLLANDLYPNLNIIASDIRESILHNLRKRFSVAGISNYSTFLADLTIQSPIAATAGADLILADLPCTGSGTWGRTPEALYFFDPAAIQGYADRQRAILRHVAGRLKPDAWLVYCTCSVFKKENEEIAAWLESTFDLRPDFQNVLIGYDRSADTLFAARFSRT